MEEKLSLYKRIIGDENSMSNVKKREFYDVITGDYASEKNYRLDASIFKKVDNVDLIFDSRGSYLGIRTCRGKFINGKYTCKRGMFDFKSFIDLKIWGGKQCSGVDFIETGEGVFMQIRK